MLRMGCLMEALALICCFGNDQCNERVLWVSSISKFIFLNRMVVQMYLLRAQSHCRTSMWSAYVGFFLHKAEACQKFEEMTNPRVVSDYGEELQRAERKLENQVLLAFREVT